MPFVCVCRQRHPRAYISIRRATSLPHLSLHDTFSRAVRRFVTMPNIYPYQLGTHNTRTKDDTVESIQMDHLQHQTGGAPGPAPKAPQLSQDQLEVSQHPHLGNRDPQLANIPQPPQVKRVRFVVPAGSIDDGLPTTEPPCLDEETFSSDDESDLDEGARLEFIDEAMDVVRLICITLVILCV